MARSRSRSRSRDRDHDTKRARSRSRRSRRERESDRKRSRSDRDRGYGRDRERGDRGHRRDKDYENRRDGERRDRDRDHRRRERDSRHDRDRDRDRDRERGRDREGPGSRERSKEEVDHRSSPRRSGSRGRRSESAEPRDNARETANGNAKKEPISLEELIKKRQEKAEAAAKPVFLTKQQRQELALKALEEKRSARERQLEQMREEHARTLEESRRAAQVHDAELRAAQAMKDPREREKLLEDIKRTYLGGGPPQKRKVTTGNERMRFKFEWDATEDTMRNANPLLGSSAGVGSDASLLFGRGRRAGVDREQQMKESLTKAAQHLRRYRTEDEIKELEQIGAADHWKKRETGALAKVRHWSEKKLEEMDQRDWRIFFEDFNISYKGTKAEKPLRYWTEMKVPKELLKAIDRLGWKEPSPIQRAAIPLGLAMRDVIGIAETGSGKTCAFVVPMVTFISRLPKMTDEVAANGPYAIIMAPTRELAQQIEEETKKLMHYTAYRCVSVVGGESLDVQASALRRGTEVVIATPGRVCDHIERQYLVLNQCNYIVLDEADRMIDLGLELQVNQVMDAMPKGKLKPESEDAILDPGAIYRITYMFSATMPPTVERIARKYMRNPVVCTIGSAGSAATNVTQKVMMIKPSEREDVLMRTLENFWAETEDDRKVIVFANTKAACDMVQRILERRGYNVSVLHSGKAQEAREHAIRSFRDGTNPVLLATDIAGRGIDVPNVQLVINYEMPNKIEPYTHRIGRTGRAGKKGTAVSLCTAADEAIFFDLKKMLEGAKQAVPPELARHPAAQKGPGG